MSFEEVYSILNNRFEEYNFDSGHRLDHALVVASHAYSAFSDFQLVTIQKDAILLACILHDVNDHKFIHHKNDILSIHDLLLKHVNIETIGLVIKIIDLISCSKNGDSVVSPTWLAIPRYADRLEAMGEIGLKRAIWYSSHENRPFIDQLTERAYTEEDLNRIATKDRYQEYVTGRRVTSTTMDHLYDKVLHLTIPDWLESTVLKRVADRRNRWLRQYIISYFNNNDLNYVI